MRHLAIWPLAWGSGLAAGVTVAVARGPYGPSWGVALAFLSVALLFSLGAWKERSLGPAEGEGITHLLRLTAGFTAGFLLTSVPLTLVRLADVVDSAGPERLSETLAEVAQLRMQLVARWALIALAFVCAVAALLLRDGRGSRRAPHAPGAAPRDPTPRA